MMPRQYTTKPGDMLDLICFREYGGRMSGIVEQVLDANYPLRLADLPPELPVGLTIVLPDIPATTLQRPTQALWD